MLPSSIWQILRPGLRLGVGVGVEGGLGRLPLSSRECGWLKPLNRSAGPLGSAIPLHPSLGASVTSKCSHGSLRWCRSRLWPLLLGSFYLNALSSLFGLMESHPLFKAFPLLFPPPHCRTLLVRMSHSPCLMVSWANVGLRP